MQHWKQALQKANTAKRCGAKTRKAMNPPCQSPAMGNGRCRMHGGASTGAPCGKSHGRYVNGRYTQEAKERYRIKRKAMRIISRFLAS